MVQSNRNPLHEQLVKILKQNPRGATMTRRHRTVALAEVVKMLRDRFGLRNLRNLKPKHTDYVVETWKATDNGRGAIQNNLSHLRWLLDKLGKSALVPSNRKLGIKPRKRNVRQGRFVTDEQLQEVLEKLDDPRLRAVVLLGRHFGMRFEEASLWRPQRDFDRTMGRVYIKRGTKGGKERFVQVTTPEQRQVLDLVSKEFPGPKECAVPKLLSYIEWKGRAYKRLRKVGISRKTVSFHDLRRTWARAERDRLLDKGESPEDAQKIVAKRMGHNRLDVLAAYFITN